MDMIQNKDKMPSMTEIENYITGDSRKLWKTFIADIETSYNTKPKITYSVCSAKPGWNVKYKKSGKALCTLYPENNSFTALIVLGQRDMEVFEPIRDTYSNYVNDLYDKTKLLGSTKWLMIHVDNHQTADNCIKLIKLK